MKNKLGLLAISALLTATAHADAVANQAAIDAKITEATGYVTASVIGLLGVTGAFVAIKMGKRIMNRA